MLVDTHCHLYFDELIKDIEGVLNRADELGVNLSKTESGGSPSDIIVIEIFSPPSIC